jgi:hypothetical protein
MRFLVKISADTKKFNELIANGTAEQKMQTILADAKPEAAYFMEMDRKRTLILIINMKDVSQIPAYSEPWFLGFDADLEWHPVMMGENLARAGIADLGKKWS